MKQAFLISILFLSILSFGQKYWGYNKKNSFSMSVETTLLYKDANRNSEPSIYFTNLEWHRGTKTNHYHFFKFGYGRTFFKNYSQSEPLAHFEYSYGKKRNNHLFDVGLGIVSTPFTYLHLRFGYRLYIKRFIIQAAYTPSLWLRTYYDEQESPHLTGFHGISIGVNYRFDEIINKYGGTIFSSFQTIQLNTYPFLISPVHSHSPKYSIFIETDYLLFQQNLHKFLFSIGFGSLSGNFLFPLGLNYLFGNKSHLIEVGLRYMSHKDNADNNFIRHHFLQPQLGYRYNFNKPFFIRTAYAPYFRIVDWKFRDGMKQSMIFGVGYRFGI